MLSALGYIINSIIFIVVVIVSACIYINLSKKEAGDLPMGPLVKELSDLILACGRKFVPLNDDTQLLIVILCISMIFIFIVKSILIG